MTESMQLLKGLEEEVYAGERSGKIVGLSPKIAATIPGFTTEPDSRNIESVTDPCRTYAELKCQLQNLRMALRNGLKQLGDYTLIPGGSMSLGNSKEFLISKPEHPYYQWIRDHYGSNVVTTSAHINMGIEDPETILRCYRLLRLEASYFLALSASSPFLDGQVTGFHSTRWHIFPATPKQVPFFKSHTQFQTWVEEQIKVGLMQNKRHLWLAIRPNGPESPVDLNRLELRVCDHTLDLDQLMGLAAFMEARVWHVLENENLDLQYVTDMDDESLQQLCQENEAAVAKNSLEAVITDWRDGVQKPIREMIEQSLESSKEIAKRRGFDSQLSALEDILICGNTAQRWLKKHKEGLDVASIVREAIQEMEEHDQPCVLT